MNRGCYPLRVPYHRTYIIPRHTFSILEAPCCGTGRRWGGGGRAFVVNVIVPIIIAIIFYYYCYSPGFCASCLYCSIPSGFLSFAVFPPCSLLVVFFLVLGSSCKRQPIWELHFFVGVGCFL